MIKCEFGNVQMNGLRIQLYGELGCAIRSVATNKILTEDAVLQLVHTAYHGDEDEETSESAEAPEPIKNESPAEKDSIDGVIRQLIEHLCGLSDD